MAEIAMVVGDADDGLRERLDAEINAFNVAATGYEDATRSTWSSRSGDQRYTA